MNIKVGNKVVRPDRRTEKQIEDKNAMNEAYKGRNICPKCGGDIDALNSPEAFNGTWTTCEELLNEK